MTPPSRRLVEYVAGDPEYLYPEAGDEPPPGGANVLLLTEGGICVRGQWRDGMGFLAWSRMPKRDKATEVVIEMARTYAQTADRILMLRKLLKDEGPLTSAELSEKSGLSVSRVSALLNVANDRCGGEFCHIGGWRKGTHGMTAAWKFGPGDDAPRPTRMKGLAGALMRVANFKPMKPLEYVAFVLMRK